MRSAWDRLVRLVHYRLIVPIKRSKHPPSYTAHGSLVGLAWAFTPLIGIQMYLVFMTWLIGRKFFRYDFNVIVAMAWTWVTNVFTMLPTYYVFYVTGQILLGRWDDLGGYHGFVKSWNRAFGEGDWGLSSLGLYLKLLAAEQGLTMMIGSLPWAALFGWLGYRWTLAFLAKREERRQARALRRTKEGLV
jgi:uncharacterized protein (DUF2062 family)